MRDSFVADIGDFGKFGLLRGLFGTPGDLDPGLPVNLGVVWYYNIDPAGPDGNRIDYLNVSGSNARRFMPCDQGLYMELRRLVGNSLAANDQRNIQQIQDLNILRNAEYHGVPLPFPHNQQERNNWSLAATTAMQNQHRNVIFLDPDNGLRVNNNSSEHASVGEIAGFYAASDILIVYQHLRQGQTAADLIDENIQLLNANIQPAPVIRALRWHRVTGRIYFILAHPGQVEILNFLMVK